MCDFFLLLMLAGAGDQLQGIKRGIMEMCDGMLITKADGENARAASKARGEYMGALHLFPPRASGWIPRVAECSAIEQTGLSEAWDMIASFERWMKDRGLFAAHRLEQDMDWLRTGLRDRLQEEFFRSASVQAALEKYSEELRHGRITPFQAADEIWKLRH